MSSKLPGRERSEISGPHEVGVGASVCNRGPTPAAPCVGRSCMGHAPCNCKSMLQPQVTEGGSMNKPVREAIRRTSAIFDAAVARERSKRAKCKKEGCAVSDRIPVVTKELREAATQAARTATVINVPTHLFCDFPPGAKMGVEMEDDEASRIVDAILTTVLPNVRWAKEVVVAEGDYLASTRLVGRTPLLIVRAKEATGG